MIVTYLRRLALAEIMTSSLQSLKDFANNHYPLLGVGATLGAGALLALGYSFRWKKREMSSFPNLTNNPTITGKLLTPDMFSVLKDKRTSKGYDLDNLIESSQHNPSANFTSIPTSAGLLAGDEECYDLFSELIDRVIGEVHQIDDMKSLRSEVSLNWKQIKSGKLYGANVLSCRLSTSRNIQGYRLIPGCQSEELLDIAHLIIKTLKSIEGAFEESYLSLPWQHKKLALLDYGLHPNSFPPQLSRDWPKGRFIWFTADRQCRIFVNFIDHMKLVITQPGGDIQNAFRQYSKLLSAIEGCLTRKGNKFMWSSKYGFLTSSPHDVGTGLEVQVKARLPKLIKDPRFERIIDVLPIRVELAVDPQNKDVVCISNKHKLQLTEVDIIQQVINSISLLLEIDKRIQRGENILDLLP